MKHNIELPEADFFQVYLRGHLIDHHFPQRDNKNFIETRSDDAYDTFVSASLEGKPVQIARELAMRTLLAGLYVSRYDIIYNVVDAKLYNDNKVDVIIYAVERSLDSYKFNLLHCKQTFISQLKRGALGARTIDEGSMDENTGMNFSEYMAILSGNTDLLEKAKLEKRIAALESERKAHGKGKADSEYKLRSLNDDIGKNEITMRKMQSDLDKYQAAVRRDDEGNPLPGLTLDGCRFTDIQNMGIHLQGLAQRTNTHEYVRVGEVYGFPISIASEKTLTDGIEAIQNRFVVEGEYKYKYNNGFIAMSDTKTTCMNFVNALERLPEIIRQYEERTEKMRKDVPLLEAIIAKPWGKEDELKALKSELAALDRKITAELAPKHDEKDGEEVKHDDQTQHINRADAPSQSIGTKDSTKDSMVAEPLSHYLRSGGNLAKPIYKSQIASANVQRSGMCKR